MRRSIPILVILFYVTSLGAAPGPNSSESTRTNATGTSKNRTIKKFKGERPHNSRPYQIGIASWYGKQFQGKPTATGEPYDMHQFTAAKSRSAANSRNVLVTSLGSNGCTRATPPVDCTVSAVMHATP